MRIAIVGTGTYALPPRFYGGEVFFHCLSRGFHELGRHVSLYGAPGSLPPDPACRECRLRYIPAGDENMPLAEYLAATWYYEEIVAHDYVLDCSHNHYVAETAGWYHREHQQKIVIVPNGVASEYPRCGMYNVVVGSKKWKELMLYGRSQFYGTAYAKQYGETVRPVPEEDFLGIVQWAVDCNFYTPGEALPEDYLLFLGRATPYKGLAMALEVAARAKARLKIAPALQNPAHRTEFESHKPLIEQAVKDGAQVEVVQLPMTSQHHVAKRELYRRAKALLFLVQAHEPFGLTLVEGLACGTPAIGSNLGALPEIINQGQTGFLCRNVDEMVQAVAEVGALNRKAIRDDSETRWHYTRAAKDYLALLEGR